VISISPTLGAANGRICCIRCGFALADVGKPWKEAANMRELNTDALQPEKSPAQDKGDTVLRLFVCTGCGVILDSETALDGEPFLVDVVIV
jgi:acetone carboxylase gamma subunit